MQDSSTLSERKRPIVVLGSVNRDLTISVEHFPSPGDTITGSDFIESIGGKGSNQAVMASRLGGNVTLMAAIGSDGDAIRESLKADGVDISHLATRREVATGTALIVLDKSGENEIILAPGANATLSSTDLNPEWTSEDMILLCQQEVPEQVLIDGTCQVKEAGGTVILNPAPMRKISPNLLDNCDYIIPNEGELTHLLKDFEIESLPKSFEEIAQAVTGVLPHLKVIVTLGARGALLCENGTYYHVATNDVAVVDTVGAGDTFCAAFAVALSQGATPHEALSWAVRAGTVAVGYPGAQGAFRNPTDLEQLGPIV